MSFIRVPDPHPGRCQNYRTVQHPDGHVESLRCLDYEGTQHVCTFPEPVHRASSIGSFTVTKPIPQPWVKPGDEASQPDGDVIDG